MARNSTYDTGFIKGSRKQKPKLYRDFVEVPLYGEDNTHVCERDGCKRIIINVSGMKFETQERTLRRVPNTLLGDPARRQKFWDEKRNEYFFDRHRLSFAAILFYYQSGGKLNRPEEVPPDVFLEEIIFYGLGKSVISEFLERDGMLVYVKSPLPINPLKRKVWEAFDIPSSSSVAKLISVVSVLTICLSITSFCAETMPSNQEIYGCRQRNGRAPVDNKNISASRYGPVLTGVGELGNPFFIIESICISWFTIEFLCRFFSCPNKCIFLKSILNWVDLASVVPFYVLVASIELATEETRCSIGQTTSFLGTFRTVRIVRIFKLTKHSQGLRVLVKTIQSGINEFTMFGLFFLIALLVFSSAIYYAEVETNSKMFPSIPATFYFTVISMTTVGYGDIYPKTVAGKIMGSACLICGVLAIALPIPVIVAKFTKYYYLTAKQKSNS